MSWYIRTNVSINALNEVGDSTGIMDERTDAGLTADEFAKAFVKKLGKRSEFYIGRQEVLIVYLKKDIFLGFMNHLSKEFQWFNF